MQYLSYKYLYPLLTQYCCDSFGISIFSYLISHKVYKDLSLFEQLAKLFPINTKQWLLNWFSPPFSKKSPQHRRSMTHVIFFIKYIPNTILIHCMQSISREKWELDNNKGQVAKSWIPVMEYNKRNKVNFLN